MSPQLKVCTVCADNLLWTRLQGSRYIYLLRVLSPEVLKGSNKTGTRTRSQIECELLAHV